MRSRATSLTCLSGTHPQTLLQAHPQPFPSDLDVLRAGIAEAHYGAPAPRRVENVLGGEGEDEAAAAKWGSWEESWDRVVKPLLAP